MARTNESKILHNLMADCGTRYGTIDASAFCPWQGGFMFIETYYDEKAAVLGNTSEKRIPYPELAGEELTVWREYLPFNRPVDTLHSFNGFPVPDTVRAEVKRAKQVPHLFDRIEIWSRTDDPMAVGVIGDVKPRYFSIARWGDAELTLAQVKRKLRVEKWILSLTWLAWISLSFAAAMYMVLE
jgi:hypothetical protein